MSDWTTGPDGVSNSSEQFRHLVAEVERLIRGDAHMLIAGRADRTAGLIMAQLAHRHGMRPASEIHGNVNPEEQ